MICQDQSLQDRQVPLARLASLAGERLRFRGYAIKVSLRFPGKHAAFRSAREEPSASRTMRSAVSVPRQMPDPGRVVPDPVSFGVERGGSPPKSELRLMGTAFPTMASDLPPRGHQRPQGSVELAA